MSNVDDYTSNYINVTHYQEMDNNYNSLDILIDNIIYLCRDFMGGKDLVKLNNVLIESFENYELVNVEEDYVSVNYKEENALLLDKFLETKSLEGCTSNTIKGYDVQVSKFLEWINKSFREISSDDIRSYLKYKMTVDNCSNGYADTILRYLRSCFKWLADEGYLYSNPTTAIPKIKSKKSVKEPFTSMEIEKLREYFKTIPNREVEKLRDTAIFELLLSSGIRIGELTQLNKHDIDWRERSFVVLGKGEKERKCYFNVKAKKALQEYLSYRDDDLDPLFISSKKGPGDRRVTVNSVGRRIRDAGKRVGVHAHPHKFRRTFATDLLRKGVPLEQVQALLGHDNIETTTLYAIVDDEQVKFNHRRLMD